MAARDALIKNIRFWHEFPELLVKDLSPDQLAWQPEQHDSSIIFAMWHAYRANDELLSALVMQRPSEFVTGGWADRLPVAEKALTPFGNGFSREQIARVRPEASHVIAYAKAVGEHIASYLDDISEDVANEEIKLPFFTNVYPGADVMSRIETVTFFAVGHTAEHLGEVQMLRGMICGRGSLL